MFNEKNIKPMLLKEISKPFQDINYTYELKFDGLRAIMYVSKNEFVIKSRNGNDLTATYPELKNIKKIVQNQEVIFDGEIVTIENNKTSFKKLQERNNLKNPLRIKEMQKEIPVAFIAFDILYQNKSLLEEPLEKRQQLLNKYSNTNYFIKSKIYKNGPKLFKEIKKLGLEGIVAKEKNSLYYPGKRTDNWLKIKNIKEDYFYVHGYIFNTNKYSLILGEYKNKKWYYVGKVSVMPNTDIIKKVLKLSKRKNILINYDEKISFVRPIYKVLVSYLEKTPEGKLRQPVFRA